MERVIEVSKLVKHYGTVEAVKGIDFYVEEGSLFAFLGPNGAGKSTTITMITTLLEPTIGSIIVNGLEVGKQDDEIREQIGIVFQEHFLDAFLTVKENLLTRAAFYRGTKEEHLKRVEEAMDVVQITELANRPYGKLSGGQRRRADIARALLNRPKILFLDEPTTGLDPQTRKNVWDTIRRLQKELSMTVFLTTHYMEEAAVADYVVVIDNGNIVAKGSPFELKERYAVDRLELYPIQQQPVLEVLDEGHQSYEVKNGCVTVELDHPMDSLKILDQVKHLITNFQVLHGTMDDAFIRITGKEIRE